MNPETDSNANSQASLLVIDDEENMRHMLRALLSRSGYSVDTASDGMEGLQKVEKVDYDYILCDLKMPKMDGMEFLKTFKSESKSTSVIMMSAYGTIDNAIEAMKMGAYDYISKPFKPDEVLMALKKAQERESLKRENIRLKQQIRNFEENFKFGKLIARSKMMKDVFDLSSKVAKYSTTVLITGESGTGKELIARGIHVESERADMPWIPVNCGGIPENLLESEFFGYKKGAFTGADRNKKGLFEEADGGTIFLDEIGELPKPLQVKLLRVLQESEVRQIGDHKTRKINVRVIAATAKDLEEEAGQGKFRQDLFYRLNVMPIRLPPLRERPEDIPLLSVHFMDKFRKSLNKNVTSITPDAMNILTKYLWPGNVRELENLIERAVVLTEDTVIRVNHLPLSLSDPRPRLPEIADIFEGYSLKAAQKILEKEFITKALETTGGNRTRASQLLEISHPSLLTKIKAYDIDM